MCQSSKYLTQLNREADLMINANILIPSRRVNNDRYEAIRSSEVCQFEQEMIYST